MDFELTTIARIKGGDSNAFELLVKRYEKRIFLFVANMINNSGEAEDLVQEIFFSAYKNITSFDPCCGSFCNWLYRIARNRCINELKRKKEILIKELPVSMEADDPAEDLLKREAFERLDYALYRLSPKNRALFIMAELEGLTYEEIAGIEGLRIGTVKSRLFRIRERLKKLIKDI